MEKDAACCCAQFCVCVKWIKHICDQTLRDVFVGWIHLVDAWSLKWIENTVCTTVGMHSVKDGFLEQNTMWSCHAMIVRVFRLACSKWNFFGQKRWSLFFFWDTLHQNSMKHVYIDIQAFALFCGFWGFKMKLWIIILCRSPSLFFLRVGMLQDIVMVAVKQYPSAFATWW